MTNKPQTFKELLTEGAAPTSRGDFIKQAEASFKKHFPNGFFRASGGALGGDKSVHIYAVLHGGDKVTNHNDQMQISAWLHNSVDADGNMKGKVVLEWDRASLSTNPEEGSYMAMGRVKLGLRKKTGTPEAVLKAIANSFKKSAGVVLDNVDNIYRGDLLDPKFLKINK